MTITVPASLADRIAVVRYRERFTTCASCRAAAVGMVLIDGKPGSTVCTRHVTSWVRRAVEQLSKEAA